MSATYLVNLAQWPSVGLFILLVLIPMMSCFTISWWELMRSTFSRIGGTMCRTARLVATLWCATACGGHGYGASIFARGVDSTKTDVLQQVTAVARVHALNALSVDVPSGHPPGTR